MTVFKTMQTQVIDCLWMAVSQLSNFRYDGLQEVQGGQVQADEFCRWLRPMAGQEQCVLQ
jgi:hypothetical protein